MSSVYGGALKYTRQLVSKLPQNSCTYHPRELSQSIVDYVLPLIGANM